MPINFSDDLLSAATNGLNRIVESVRNEFVGSYRAEHSFYPDEARARLERAVEDAKEDFIRDGRRSQYCGCHNLNSCWFVRRTALRLKTEASPAAIRKRST